MRLRITEPVKTSRWFPFAGTFPKCCRCDVGTISAPNYA